MELVEKKLWMVCTLSLWHKPEEVVTYVDVDTSHVEFYKDWGGLTYSKDEWHKGEVFVETEEEAEQLRQTYISDLKSRIPSIKRDLTCVHKLDLDQLKKLFGVTWLRDVLGPFWMYVRRCELFDEYIEKHEKVCRMYDDYIKTGSLLLKGAHVKAADVTEVVFLGKRVTVETRYRVYQITDEPTVEFLKHLYEEE